MEADAPQIPGRFEIREELYRSDQNVRLRAFDTTLEQEVVLEYSGRGVMELTPTATEKARNLRQARMRARVKHPHVQPLKEVIDLDGIAIHVLEPRPGETLETLLQSTGVQSPRDTIRLGIDLADAFQALHAEGVVHRAIAASNILVQGPGELSAVTGFAFAKPIEAAGQSSVAYYRGERETPASRALPEHPAPEQVAGQAADARSDIFALGCVLYRCLTLRSAFEESTVWRQPPDLRHLVPEIPKALAAVVSKCLSHSPMSRYPTMLEVARALREVEQKTGEKRRPKVPWPIAAAVPLAVGAAWFGFYALPGAPEPGENVEVVAAPPRKVDKHLEPRYDKSHALLIGIGYESHPSFRKLDYAEKDVAGIAEDLLALGFEKPVVLLGKAAKYERIRQELNELEGRAGRNDQVLVYFSGHGDVHSMTSSSSYVLPSDATSRPSNRGSGDNWLPMSEFKRRLGEYRAKHVMLMFDCCHSGAIFGNDRSAGVSTNSSEPTVGRDYEIVFLQSEAKVIMVSCTADDSSPDESFFAAGFREMLKRAKDKPVTHTAIEAHIKELGVERKYLNLSRSERMLGTTSDFLFLPRSHR